MPEKDETENKKRNLVNRYDNDMRDKDETEKKKDLVNRYDWDRRNEKVKLNDLFVTNIGNGNIWNGGYITYVAASCLQTPHAPHTNQATNVKNSRS